MTKSDTPRQRAEMVLTLSDKLHGVKDVTPYAVKELLFIFADELAEAQHNTNQAMLDAEQNSADVMRAFVLKEQAEQRLAELIKVANKPWNILADWLDMKYPNDANPEIQRDLRTLNEMAAALAQSEQSEKEKG